MGLSSTTAMEATLSRIGDPHRLRHLHARALVVPSLEELAREFQG
jgi:hypothetical protein